MIRYWYSYGVKTLEGIIVFRCGVKSSDTVANHLRDAVRRSPFRIDFQVAIWTVPKVTSTRTNMRRRKRSREVSQNMLVFWMDVRDVSSA